MCHPGGQMGDLHSHPAEAHTRVLPVFQGRMDNPRQSNDQKLPKWWEQLEIWHFPQNHKSPSLTVFLQWRNRCRDCRYGVLETDEEDDVPLGEASELADHWPRARMKNEKMIVTSGFLPWGMRVLVYVPRGAEAVELEEIPCYWKKQMLHLPSRNRIQFHFSPRKGYAMSKNKLTAGFAFRCRCLVQW